MRMSIDLLDEDLVTESDFEALGLRECSPLPPGFPETWRSMRLHVSVGLILTETTCLSRWLFKEFAVTSVEEAVQRVVATPDIFLCYGFFPADTAVFPACVFDAEWPLSRRGSAPLIRREPVQGPEPWRWSWDRTLFSISNHPIGAWSSRTYLRVGGLTPTEAVSNWTACAPVIRSLRPRKQAQG
jgi:hypothetical protein